MMMKAFETNLDCMVQPKDYEPFFYSFCFACYYHCHYHCHYGTTKDPQPCKFAHVDVSSCFLVCWCLWVVFLSVGAFGWLQKFNLSVAMLCNVLPSCPMPCPPFPFHTPCVMSCGIPFVCNVMWNSIYNISTAHLVGRLFRSW